MSDLWATATAHERTHDPREVDHGEQLANQVDQWMTPFGMGNVDATGKRGGGGEFAKAVEGWIGWTPDAPTWPTPDGQVFQDGMDCTLEEWEERRRRLKAECKIPNGNGAGTPLAMAAHLWSEPPSARPTAGANDHKGSNRPGQRRGQLDEATEHWLGDLPEWKREEMLEKGWHTCDGCGATTFHDMVTPCLGCGEIRSGTVTYPSSLPAPATATDGVPSSPPTPTSPRPRLNPCFVAWLMGWPLTALGISGCLEMESSRSRPPTPSVGSSAVWFRRMRSELLRLTGR